jgi:hypothetical protein
MLGCHKFFSSCFGIPRLALQDFLRQVEGRKAKLLVTSGFIHDVNPLLAPALDGVGKFQIKISGIGPDTDADTTYVVGGATRIIAAEVKDALPHAPVRVDAKEALAKSDKDGYVRDGIGSQMI